MDTKCPNCGGRVKVEGDAWESPETVCPACNRTFFVAAAMLNPASTALARPVEEPVQSKPAPKKDSDRVEKSTEAYVRETEAYEREDSSPDRRIPPKTGTYALTGKRLIQPEEVIFKRGDFSSRFSTAPGSEARRPPPPEAISGLHKNPISKSRAAAPEATPQPRRPEPTRGVEGVKRQEPRPFEPLRPQVSTKARDVDLRVDNVFSAEQDRQAEKPFEKKPVARPGSKPPPEEKQVSISDFFGGPSPDGFFSKPAEPAPVPEQAVSHGGLGDLDLSFDDLTGAPASKEQSAPMGWGAPEPAPVRARTPAGGGLDLDEVLKDDSGVEPVVPWLDQASGAATGVAPEEAAAVSIAEPARTPDRDGHDVGGLDLDLNLGETGYEGAFPAEQPAGTGGPGEAFSGGFEFQQGPGAGVLEPDFGSAGPTAIDRPGVAVPAAQSGMAPPLKKPAGKPAGLRAVAVAVLLVALIGVILGQTNYGYFGINIFLPPSPERAASRKVVGKPGQMAGIVRDTKEAFQEEIDRLERMLKEDPDNMQAKADYLEVLLRFRERYPSAFAVEPRFAVRLNQIKGQAQVAGAKADMVRVMDLVDQGKFDEARTVLDAMVVASAQDADVLYFYGKVALGGGKPEEAQRYFELALMKNPDLVAAKFFLARTFLAQKNPAKGKTILEEILAREPEHLAAKVALAEMALAGHDLDMATKLAGEVIGKAASSTKKDELFNAHLVLSKVLDARGAREDRMRELRAALAIRPEDEETAVTLARLLMADKKDEEALSVLGPCRQKGCSGEEFYATYAQAAFAEVKEDVAEAALKEGAQKYPKSTRFALIRGRWFLDNQKARAAVAALEDALKLNPKAGDVYVLLAEALAKAGKPSEAVARLKEGLDQGAVPLPLLEALAQIHLEQRDFTAAEDTLRKIVSAEPANTKALEQLGLVVAGLGRTGEARTVLEPLETRRALSRKGRLGLAAAYLDAKEPVRAQDLLARVYTEAPDDPEVATSYAHALIEAGNTEKAQEVLRKVTEANASYGPGFYYLGRFYRKTGDRTRALDSLVRAVRLQPANHKFRLELAATLLEQPAPDNVRDAKQQLDAVIASYERGDVVAADRDADAYLIRGRLLFKAQNFQGALKDFETALAIAPASLDLLVESGRTLYELARFDDAAPYLRQVLGRDPQHPEANYFLGRILLRANQIQAAKMHLERSVAKDARQFPEAHRYLGLILKDEGLVKLAKQRFQQYLLVAPKNTPEAEEIKTLLEKML